MDHIVHPNISTLISSEFVILDSFSITTNEENVILILK